MRRIAIASLIALACDSGKDPAPETKTSAEAKATEVKAEAKAAEVPAEVKGVEPEPEPEPAPPADDPGEEICATIIPCYQKLEFAGSFMADVTADIEPDGSVSSVSFTGEAPKPVQTCITDAVKNTTLPDYNGKLGRVRCTMSGQLMGGTQMVMSDSSYTVREAGEAKAEAGEAEPEAKKAGKAKAG